MMYFKIKREEDKKNENNKKRLFITLSPVVYSRLKYKSGLDKKKYVFYALCSSLEL